MVMRVKGAAINTDEASLLCLLLTSCCVAQVLIGHIMGSWSIAQGLGNPDLGYLICWYTIVHSYSITPLHFCKVSSYVLIFISDFNYLIFFFLFLFRKGFVNFIDLCKEPLLVLLML